MTWEPLEPYVGGSAGHDHASFHVVEARGRVAGLAWTDGRIMLAPWLEAQPAGAVEVFLAEAAHQVDFFAIAPDQRRQLFALFHGGDGTPHADHGWFEEAGSEDYWSWVGESWMSGFMLAYSDVAPSWGSMVHKVGPEARGPIRAILAPPVKAPYFGARRSKVFHDLHAGVRSEVEFLTRIDALAAGRRPCTVCRP